jgi:hypothetical protein
MLAFIELFTFFKVCGSNEMSLMFLVIIPLTLDSAIYSRGRQSQREKESENDN